jgi:hypothetical protein
LPWIRADIDKDAHLTSSENLKSASGEQTMPRGVATARSGVWTAIQVAENCIAALQNGCGQCGDGLD